MSYGLYISNGTAGAVITNSNNIFNEEIFFFFFLTVTAGNSTSLTIEDVGDPSLISIDLETNDDISLSASGNTLNISNSGSVDFTFDLKVFRFQ